MSLRSRIRGGQDLLSDKVASAAQFLTLRSVVSVSTEVNCDDPDGPGHAPRYLDVRRHFMTTAQVHNKLKVGMSKIGFSSNKSRIYYKEFDLGYSVVLLDYTRDPTEFRLWSTIRIKPSMFDALALNGICSYGNIDKSLNTRICYGKVSPTIDDLVVQVIGYTTCHYLPWFAKYNTLESLCGVQSPLNEDDKKLLMIGELACSKETMKVLGI